DVGRTRSLSTAAWEAAIGRAATQPGLELGVAPTGANRTASTSGVLTLLGSANLSTPSAPRNLTLVTATRTALKLGWSSERTAYRYGVYRNGALVQTVRTSGTTLAALACGTSYRVDVDSVTRYGKRSAKTTVNAATSACSSSTPPPPPPPPAADGFVGTSSIG